MYIDSKKTENLFAGLEILRLDSNNGGRPPQTDSIKYAVSHLVHGLI